LFLPPTSRQLDGLNCEGGIAARRYHGRAGTTVPSSPPARVSPLIALLLTAVGFFTWWAIGLSFLTGVGADTANLRVALTAPALGSAVVVIPLFMLSDFGVPMRIGGPIVLIAEIVASLVVLAIRRPAVPSHAFPVAGIALVHLILVGRPMFRFGLNWLANANTDMGYYVLSATSLLNSGLRSPVNHAALSHGRDLATVAHQVHELGIRVGADVVLSALAATTGRFSANLYMPLSMSVSMCGICAAAALAMQCATRERAAIVAAALLAVSPLATYGVLQQLLPQVWGLALAAALFALLMRPELHARARPRLAELIPVWILAIALFVVYVELAGSLTVAYGVYLAFLATRRRLALVGALRLWVPAAAGLVLVENFYLPRAIGYLLNSAHAGVTLVGSRRLFPNALAPTALPGFAGFQSLFATPSTRFMTLSILAAMLVVGASLVAAVVTARRGDAASAVVVGDLILGVLLALEKSDFGLFKLYMYVQPFLAACVGVWIAAIGSRVVLRVAVLVVVAVVTVQASTQSLYVRQSFDPVDLRHASEADLLPAFRSLLARARLPVISVTDNVELTDLEGAAASAAGRPLQFLSLTSGTPLTEHTFRVMKPNDTPVSFSQARGALALLARQRCQLAISSGSQTVMNRRQLPEGRPDVVPIACARARNLLAFVASSAGGTFGIAAGSVLHGKRLVSFWQLEPDFAFPGRTMSGFGRYALLEVLNPTPGARLELSFTRTPISNPSLSFQLPAATVTGSRRLQLPVTGEGSARIFSPALRPQMIDGHPYVLLDMGEDGVYPPVARPGLTSLWGRSIHLDTRVLTSYIRSVSLVSAQAFRSMTSPSSIERFPDDLGNKNLEYSGIFEDGWVGRDSYVVLAPRGVTHFVLRANVIAAPDQRLTITIDGERVWSKPVAAGELDVRLPVSHQMRNARVRLHWAVTKRLGPQDPRPAAAHLGFLGFVS
jgi:hypothetical protein